MGAALQTELEALAERLRPLAWGAEFVGRFVYAEASGASDLGKISGAAGSNLGQNLGVRGNLSNEISIGLSIFLDPFHAEKK